MRDTLTTAAQIALPTGLIEAVDAIPSGSGNQSIDVVKLALQAIIAIAGLWKLLKSNKKNTKTP